MTRYRSLRSTAMFPSEIYARIEFPDASLAEAERVTSIATNDDHVEGESIDSEPEAAGTRRLTFLGTGTSTGVPMIGCDCQVCTSSDPRNQRTRPSVLFSFPGGNLLIDTTPEMRMQLLRERVRHVHAIAFTHSHADHLFGLDDARQFPRWIGGPVPVYCEHETEQTIRRVFSYAFRPGTEKSPAGFRSQARFRDDRARRAVRGSGPERSADPARARTVSGPGLSRGLAGVLYRREHGSRGEPAPARGAGCAGPRRAPLRAASDSPFVERGTRAHRVIEAGAARS